MKKISLIILFSVLIISSFAKHKREAIPRRELVQSRDNRNWRSLSFRYVSTSGYNNYEISDKHGENPSFQSKLEYPHNYSSYGFAFQFRRKRHIYKDYFFNLSLIVNANFPADPISVSQLYNNPPLYNDFLYHYTESDARLDKFEIDVNYGREFYRNKDLMFFWSAGFLFYSYKFDYYSLYGWERNISASSVIDSFSTHQDILVSTYDVSYHGLYVGSRVEFCPTKIITFGGDAKVSPIMIALDVNDYILLFFTGESKIRGGLYVGVNGDFRIETPTDLLSTYFFIRTFGERFSFSGHQTQKWYGDDPGTSYDDTGDKIKGIPNYLEYYRSGLVLGVGFCF